MASVERTEQAELDLETIFDYLDEHSQKAADRFAKLFRESTETLARMPEIGRSRDELATDLRSFTVGKYVFSTDPLNEASSSFGLPTDRVIYPVSSMADGPASKILQLPHNHTAASLLGSANRPKDVLEPRS